MIHFQRKNHSPQTILRCLPFVAAVLAGCGGDDRNLLPRTPVQGTLYVDDKPYGPAKLTLTPVPADGSRPVVSGIVAEDGTYSLSTYSIADEEPDGAPPGEYQIGFALDALNPGRGTPALKSGSNTVTVPDNTDADEPVKLDIKLASTGRESSPLAGGRIPSTANTPGRPGGMGMGPPGR